MSRNNYYNGNSTDVFGNVASGVLTYFQLMNIHKGETVQEGGLSNQIEQIKTQGAEQSIYRNKQLQSVLATNEARSAARGISLASGSIKSVQGESIANADQADRISKMNTYIKVKGVQDQIDALQRQAEAADYNALLNFGKGILTIAALILL